MKREAFENPLSDLTPHRAPSVGAVVKKMLAVNPELSTHELIAMVRQAISVQGGPESDFATVEVINEEKALALARASALALS